MLETTRIRREGYAVRPIFADFIQRFKMLAFGGEATVPSDPSSCIQILKAGKVDGYLIGKTKVFLKYFHIDQLEHILAEYRKKAVVVQKVARG